MKNWDFYLKDLMVCEACLVIAANYIYEYKFSFMRMPAFIMIALYLLSVFYFLDTWFYYICGLLVGIMIFIPLIIALFLNSRNYIAYVFDGLISLFFMAFYGLKIYKKYKTSISSDDME